MDGSFRGSGRGGRPNARQPASSSTVVPRKRAADAEEDEWVAGEDRFVLRQAKRRAILRVRGGRARAVDWLAVVALRAVEGEEDILLDENEAEGELDVVDPEGVFEGLGRGELEELAGDIDAYLERETAAANLEFWNVGASEMATFTLTKQTMKVICKDRLAKLIAPVRAARGVSSVTADVDGLFSQKSLPELDKLEKQIRGKLDSDEDIDVDYWEHLLKTLLVWKAKARLRRISQEIVAERLGKLRTQQQEEADKAQRDLLDAVGGHKRSNASAPLDPDPFLKIRVEDKALEVIDESAYLEKINNERQKIVKLGFVPMSKQKQAPGDRVGKETLDDTTRDSNALYEREVARGVNEDEEIFAGEETVVTASQSQWDSKYRPRKPRYFNRVQMGYEWNKYNQTHYDHDNPPPKVVQGYKFNVFYPDLIDKTKAPSYRIEREGGRKRGQTFAPAGEEDTCLIRFVAGPPYEDIAFRIVDREWDYSAKRERGFRSSFERVSRAILVA
jgi:hypothetical protein